MEDKLDCSASLIERMPPKEPDESPKEKLFAIVVLQAKHVIEVPHIDFIVIEDIWTIELVIITVQSLQLRHSMDRSCNRTISDRPNERLQFTCH